MKRKMNGKAETLDFGICKVSDKSSIIENCDIFPDSKGVSLARSVVPARSQ